MNVSRISKAVAVAVGTRVAQHMNNRKLQRSELERGCDLSKLARGRAGDEPIKTHDGQLVALRIRALEARVDFERKLKDHCLANLLAEQRKSRRLTADLDAMRPMFARIATANTPADALRNVAATLNNGARSDILCELASRFEAYEKIHTEGGAKTPESASTSPLPLPGRAAETPPSGVIVGSYDTGIDKWVHGERNHEGRRYLGPCPACGRRTVASSIQIWRCTDAECEMFPLAVRQDPKWWNSDVAVIKDGNMWMATRAGFTNIQESRCEFGMSPGRAVAFLLATEMASANNRIANVLDGQSP